VATNNIQAGRLIERLYERTASEDIKWDRSVGPSRYQVRFGDYIIQMFDNGMRAYSLDAVTLEIRKLDGSLVESIGGSTNALLPNKKLPQGNVSQLAELFDLVNNSNADLDELLKLIG